jgi:hypothetical protein
MEELQKKYAVGIVFDLTLKNTNSIKNADILSYYLKIARDKFEENKYFFWQIPGKLLWFYFLFNISPANIIKLGFKVDFNVYPSYLKRPFLNKNLQKFLATKKYHLKTTKNPYFFFIVQHPFKDFNRFPLHRLYKASINHNWILVPISWDNKDELLKQFNLPKSLMNNYRKLKYWCSNNLGFFYPKSLGDTYVCPDVFFIPRNRLNELKWMPVKGTKGVIKPHLKLGTFRWACDALI